MGVTTSSGVDFPLISISGPVEAVMNQMIVAAGAAKTFR